MIVTFFAIFNFTSVFDGEREFGKQGWVFINI